MADECGCLFDVIEREINYCPKHAAADAMYEALKQCKLGCQNLVEFGYVSDADDEIDDIDAALALADGDTND